jgi:hypothetical protein
MLWGALQALRQTRSGFMTNFTIPSYNCYLTPKGRSSVEPRIDKGSPGYCANVTDKPNRGPKSIGFVPARDVVMCWQVCCHCCHR